MENHIEQQETPRKFYAMIPNMVDDMNLSPYAFRLYCHIRRRAGENGACWEGTRALAENCNMSIGSISKAKRELSDAGLIIIEEKEANNVTYHHILIVDVWQQNNTKYSDTRSPGEHPRSYSEHPRSPGERKKNPIKNNPENDNSEKLPGLPTPSQYEYVLSQWKELFPSKPQPRPNNSTLQAKLKTRMKDPYFRDNWRLALDMVRDSRFCLEGGWFTLGWFLKNDDNWQKCLDGNYANRKPQAATPQSAPQTAGSGALIPGVTV